VERLAVRGLVEGPNFGFGRDRAGDVAFLAEWCRTVGVTLDVAPSVEMGSGETGTGMVSSSRIRLALQAGDPAAARRMLGRPHRFSGVVVAGDRRGRLIGFPTANLAETAEKAVALPAVGVYAVRVRLDGRPHVGACNIGPNPTFGVDALKIEVHLLDFDGDLYDQRLDVDVLDRLRGVQTFSGIDALKTQLAEDVAAARRVADAVPADETTPHAELARTVAAWVESFVLPDVAPLGGELRSTTVDADGVARLDWRWPARTPPATQQFAVLRLGERLRRAFPRLRAVENVGTS
ncbi:MAG: riboflavin kinase, partial [Planctomycetia bacterium]